MKVNVNITKKENAVRDLEITEIIPWLVQQIDLKHKSFSFIILETINHFGDIRAIKPLKQFLKEKIYFESNEVIENIHLTIKTLEEQIDMDASGGLSIVKDDKSGALGISEDDKSGALSKYKGHKRKRKKK